MLQPKTYPELVGKALVLETEPFITMGEDDNPWVEGLFLVTCVGVLLGGAHLVGGLLYTASMPSAVALRETLLNSVQQLTPLLAPAADPAQVETTFRQMWNFGASLAGYQGGWARFFVALLVPVWLIAQWFFLAATTHVAARALGGRGTWVQTLGTSALAFAPQVLGLLTLIPFVSVSRLLLGVWGLLIVYRGIEVTHDLAWRARGVCRFGRAGRAACVRLSGHSRTLVGRYARSRLMNTSSFLQSDGTLRPRPEHGWHGWLPRRGQLKQALQFDFRVNQPDGVWGISMRQGMGLVVVAALVAGLLPFLVNWITAARMGTALPLALMAHASARAADADPGSFRTGIATLWQTLAGLPPAYFPGWLAALLSSLGAWINWPLNWLTGWIVYGTGVLVVAKTWGVPTTLQRFFAMTSYAAMPLILTGLRPIPCLGPVAVFVAVMWMLTLYVACVRAVTGLDWLRAAVVVILPGALVALVAALTGVALFASLLRMFVFPF